MAMTSASEPVRALVSSKLMVSCNSAMSMLESKLSINMATRIIGVVFFISIPPMVRYSSPRHASYLYYRNNVWVTRFVNIKNLEPHQESDLEFKQCIAVHSEEYSPLRCIWKWKLFTTIDENRIQKATLWFSEGRWRWNHRGFADWISCCANHQCQASNKHCQNRPIRQREGSTLALPKCFEPSGYGHRQGKWLRSRPL